MSATAAVLPRAIVHRTQGSTHGPITRLMSPGDLGERLKPFIFLDIFSMNASRSTSSFGMHPHSGIATVTFMTEGEVAYEDTTARQVYCSPEVWSGCAPATVSGMTRH